MNLDTNTCRDMPLNWIDRLAQAYAEAGNAAKQTAKVTRKYAKAINPDHQRKMRMYYRRYYNHIK